MNELFGFRNNFPELFEYIPGIGIIMLLHKVINYKLSLVNVAFSVLVNIMAIFII